MTDTKPEGPYRIFEADGKFVVDVPGLLLQSKNKPDAEMWVEAFNMAHDKGFKAGRASRDRLREALIPFTHADLREILTGNAIGEDSPVFQRNKAMLRIKDFSKAYEALAEDEKEAADGK